MAARRLRGHCRNSGSSKPRWHGHTSFEAKPARHVLAGNGASFRGFLANSTPSIVHRSAKQTAPHELLLRASVTDNFNGIVIPVSGKKRGLKDGNQVGKVSKKMSSFSISRKMAKRMRDACPSPVHEAWNAFG